MNTRRSLIALCAAVSFLAGCSPEPPPPAAGKTVADVVTVLADRAKAADTNYFAPLMDPSVRAEAPKLIAMINSSGMSTNFSSHLRKDSPRQARLDYHEPDLGCHFQVDLQQSGADWQPQRIYFCR